MVRSLLIQDVVDHRAANKPAKDWQYVQRVKERDAKGKFLGVSIRRIYGNEKSLERTGTRTVYVERSNLSSHLMIGRLVRKTLAFPKQLVMLKAASVWEDMAALSNW